MSDEFEFKTGWNQDNEDWDFLERATLRTFGAPASFTAPEKMSYRDILMVENQRKFGSCVGHAISTGGEGCAFLKSGTKEQFSRWFAYIQSQKASGFLGSDQGAAIAGAIKYSSEVGFCLESEYPYPNQYVTNWTKTHLESAKTRRLLGHKPLNNGNEVFDFVSQAIGFVIIGFNITDSYQSMRGPSSVVTPRILNGRFSGRGGRGHSVLLAGYQKQGEIDQIGSWDTSWGDQGWAPWTLEAVDLMCRNERGQSSVWGISDITGFDQARVDRVLAWNEVM